MVKYTSEKSGLRKGTWTPEEDKKLIAYVTRYGHWNWNLLPKFAGTSKSLILSFLPSLSSETKFPVMLHVFVGIYMKLMNLVLL